jgi:hypothetical protein
MGHGARNGNLSRRATEKASEACDRSDTAHETGSIGLFTRLAHRWHQPRPGYPYRLKVPIISRQVPGGTSHSCSATPVRPPVDVDFNGNTHSQKFRSKSKAPWEKTLTCGAETHTTTAPWKVSAIQCVPHQKVLYRNVISMR